MHNFLNVNDNELFFSQELSFDKDNKFARFDDFINFIRTLKGSKCKFDDELIARRDFYWL